MIIRESGVTIRLDCFYVLNFFSCRYLLDCFDGERIYVQCIDLARGASQLCKRQNIAAGTATIIEYTGSGLYSGFLQQLQAWPKDVTNLEREAHEFKTNARH